MSFKSFDPLSKSDTRNAINFNANMYSADGTNTLTPTSSEARGKLPNAMRSRTGLASGLKRT